MNTKTGFTPLQGPGLADCNNVSIDSAPWFYVSLTHHFSYWRPPADQKARGLWVRDCGVFRAPEPISESRMRGKWGESKTKMQRGRGGGKKPHKNTSVLIGTVLNVNVEYHFFTIGSISTVVSLMRPNCFMASLDLKDPYYSVPIVEEHWSIWKGTLYLACVFGTKA